MSNTQKFLFDTTDPRGYRVVLSSEQYNNHILSSVDHNPHNEFTPEEIKECIEQPEIIYQSESVPSRDLYFGRTSNTYPNLFLKTVVAMDEEMKTGEVVTAHLSKDLSRGKELKYVNYRSKL